MGAILDSINIDDLQYVGSGASNACFVYGDYAVKFGSMTSFDVELFNYAATKGCSIPVIEFNQDITVTKAMRAKLMEAYATNTRYSTPKYLSQQDSLNIVILPLVKPHLKYDDDYRSDIDTHYDIARELQDKYNTIVRNENKDSDYLWLDAHPWNIGYYNDTLVIIDF